MKNKKLAIMTILVMTMSLIFSSCGKTTTPQQSQMSDAKQFIPASDPSKNPSAAVNRKDTFIVGIGAPDGTFMTYYASAMNDVYVSETIFDGLMDLDAAGNPIAGIAKSWDISEDGLTYTFHMRDDVKFSDGTPVTAEDVEFTYEMVCDPSFTGQFDASTLGIKGWKDYNTSKASKIEGIKVIDPHTISFTFEESNSSILYQLAGSIISKAYYGKDYTQGNTKSVEALLQSPMGCGPYKIVKYVPGQEVDLTANENYWKGTPKIKNIVFKVTTSDNAIQQLIAGETDMDTVPAKPENIEQLKQQGFLDITLLPNAGYSYIGFNLADPRFSDKNVRQALAYGLNREQIRETLYKGNSYLCSEPQSKAHPSYLSDVNEYKFDLEKANKMLDDAGWKKGADGIREKNGVKFEVGLIASSTNPANKIIIPILKDNYAQLGISVMPETMELNSVLKKMKSHEFDIYVMGTSIGADVMTDLAGMFKSDSPYNYGQYNNPEYDKLVAEGYKENDLAKRTEIEQKIYKLANEELPVVFTYQSQVMWINNSRITGIEFEPYKHFPYSFFNTQIK